MERAAHLHPDAWILSAGFNLPLLCTHPASAIASYTNHSFSNKCCQYRQIKCAIIQTLLGVLWHQKEVDELELAFFSKEQISTLSLQHPAWLWSFESAGYSKKKNPNNNNKRKPTNKQQKPHRKNNTKNQKKQKMLKSYRETNPKYLEAIFSFYFSQKHPQILDVKMWLLTKYRWSFTWAPGVNG